MGRWVAVAAAAIFSGGILAQVPAARPAFDAFEVATVKPVDAGAKAGRLFRMDGEHRWVATNYTLEALIALAYDLNPRTISGGPSWVDSQQFNIEAITPGTLFCSSSRVWSHGHTTFNTTP